MTIQFDYLTISEAAKYLHISRQTFYKKYRDKVTPIKFGSCQLIKFSDLAKIKQGG